MHLELKKEAHNAKQEQQFVQFAKRKTLLELLLAASENFAEKCETNLRLHNDLEAQKQQLLERIQELQREQRLLQQEQLKHQVKEDAKSLTRDLSEDLENLYCLLGYRLTECQTFGNEGAKKITLHYNEYCCLKLSFGERFDLIHIQPEHPNFAQIKQFLRDTQDISGLLTNLQKYFMLDLQLNQETA